MHTNDYIRDNLLRNAKICEDHTKFTKDDIDQYRQDYYQFRDKTQMNSNEVDVVDKMNELYLSPNVEASRRHKNALIKDIFSDMTKNENIDSSLHSY
jgi:hypothetical protein